jgi:hypothetical protein
MIEINKQNRKNLTSLFRDYKWNYLPDAILDGYTGIAYANEIDNPQVSILELPSSRICIAGGDPNHPAAREYFQQLSETKAFIFTNPAWETLAEEFHKGKLIRLHRYAFTSQALDKAHLQELKATLAQEYRLEQIDLKLAEQITENKSELTSDHLTNFDSPQDFIERGFGFCILKGEELVCVASTFLVFNKGIEIQIDTRKDHRGKGLATVAAAALILHSLDKGLDPNWDAATPKSAGLAKKLGYAQQGEYDMVIIVKSKSKAVIGKILFKLAEIFN